MEKERIRAAFDVELTFMRLYQEGGTTDIIGNPIDFNMSSTPRFELGYLGCHGVGIRARYWDYDDRGLADVATRSRRWAVVYVIILFYGRFIADEPVSAARWGGVALIVAGILLVSQTSTN